MRYLKALMAWEPLAYVFSIVAVNIGFSYIPPVETGFGMFAPMALLVGAIFVIRDFAHRRIGDLILVPMGVGLVLSYLMANPYVATASAVAFALSETADYLVYKYTGKPFRVRILMSSVVSVPVDSLVFLEIVGILSGGTLVIMMLSKFVAVGIVWFLTPEEAEDDPVIQAIKEGRL